MMKWISASGKQIKSTRSREEGAMTNDMSPLYSRLNDFNDNVSSVILLYSTIQPLSHPHWPYFTICHAYNIVPYLEWFHRVCPDTGGKAWGTLGDRGQGQGQGEDETCNSNKLRGIVVIRGWVYSICGKETEKKWGWNSLIQNIRLFSRVRVFNFHLSWRCPRTRCLSQRARRRSYHRGHTDWQTDNNAEKEICINMIYSKKWESNRYLDAFISKSQLV